VAADLTSFAAPKTPDGAPLTLASTDIAVDPELGRFRLDAVTLGVTAEELRVDYLLATVASREGVRCAALSTSVPEFFALAADGGSVLLRDRLDGTPLAVAMRLGRPLDAYYGTPRGFTLRKNGVELTSTLVPTLVDLAAPGTLVPAGRVAVDLARGRFQLPNGSVVPGDALDADFGFVDAAAEKRVFESLLQRLPRALPAGVVPVLVDTRQSPVDPAKVS
jgi:hypothetical protein